MSVLCCGCKEGRVPLRSYWRLDYNPPPHAGTILDKQAQSLPWGMRGKGAGHWKEQSALCWNLYCVLLLGTDFPLEYDWSHTSLRYPQHYHWNLIWIFASSAKLCSNFSVAVMSDAATHELRAQLLVKVQEQPILLFTAKGTVQQMEETRDPVIPVHICNHSEWRVLHCQHFQILSLYLNPLWYTVSKASIRLIRTPWSV